MLFYFSGTTKLKNTYIPILFGFTNLLSVPVYQSFVPLSKRLFFFSFASIPLSAVLQKNSFSFLKQ